ncbi:MAG: methionyl-tRNA formyltransferase [Desulfitobacteriaceae bacterium]|nr:methionyl-tRNA formyltransferase [Desulfitobacteriaceae bacterium]MDD4346230.1 methionyl-tRNA formyltransferase [Desulfitobacteriaceae bacterium]MDD4401637.1 methionyl-tRNA formyltransferase [Desulfitobacteriaceae bacterium]
MRVLIIGQAPFGAECLQALKEQGENLVGAITIPDVPGAKKPNPFKELAIELGLPLFQPSNLRQPEVYEWVKKLAPDLLVLVFVTNFVPKTIIDLAPLGGINYHPSLLPKFRGGSAMAWAIISGEKETGVTIHYIDEGVDTGNIILQESVPIDPEDTTVTLYFNKLYPLGVKLTKEAVRLIREKQAPSIPQDNRLASFQPVLKAQDTIIDWRQTAQNINNLVRGATPVPGASTEFHGNSLIILEAKVLDIKSPAGTVAGEIIELIPDQGLAVATGKGILLLLTVKSANEKLTALQWAERSAVQVGKERFPS